MEANQNIISAIAGNHFVVTNSVFGPMTPDVVGALKETDGVLDALLADLTVRREANQVARDTLEEEAATSAPGRARRKVEDCIRKHPGALVAAMAALISSGYLK